MLVKDIPLYTATRELLYEFTGAMFSKTLHRDLKHTIGQRIIDIILDMLDLIRVAYDVQTERVNALETLTSKTYLCATLCKLLYDKHQLLDKQYEALAALIANIERQTSGWLSKTKAGVVEPPDGQESAQADSSR